MEPTLAASLSTRHDTKRGFYPSISSLNVGGLANRADPRASLRAPTQAQSTRPDFGSEIAGCRCTSAPRTEAGDARGHKLVSVAPHLVAERRDSSTSFPRCLASRTNASSTPLVTQWAFQDRLRDIRSTGADFSVGVSCGSNRCHQRRDDLHQRQAFHRQLADEPELLGDGKGGLYQVGGEPGAQGLKDCHAPAAVWPDLPEWVVVYWDSQLRGGQLVIRDMREFQFALSVAGQASAFRDVGFRTPFVQTIGPQELDELGVQYVKSTLGNAQKFGVINVGPSCNRGDAACFSGRTCSIWVPPGREAGIMLRWAMRESATIAHELFHAVFSHAARNSIKIIRELATPQAPGISPVTNFFRWLLESPAVAAEVCVILGPRNVREPVLPGTRRASWSTAFYTNPDWYNYGEVFTSMAGDAASVPLALEAFAEGCDKAFRARRFEAQEDALSRLAARPLATISDAFRQAGFGGLREVWERVMRQRGFYDDSPENLQPGAPACLNGAFKVNVHQLPPPPNAQNSDCLHRLDSNSPGVPVYLAPKPYVAMSVRLELTRDGATIPWVWWFGFHPPARGAFPSQFMVLIRPPEAEVIALKGNGGTLRWPIEGVVGPMPYVDVIVINTATDVPRDDFEFSGESFVVDIGLDCCTDDGSWSDDDPIWIRGK